MNTNNSREYLIEVGERLRGVRLLRGITQKQAAADTGMSQSFLSSVERGRKTACTAQIITLIHYYNVPYRMIFGEENSDFKLKEFPTVSNDYVCMDLLNMLVGKADSAALVDGTVNCLKLGVYAIFRTVYHENPKNSDKLFSIEYTEAIRVIFGILSHAPESISRFIRLSRNINASQFELPPERNAEMRSFIKECEYMITHAPQKLKTPKGK